MPFSTSKILVTRSRVPISQFSSSKQPQKCAHHGLAVAAVIVPEEEETMTPTTTTKTIIPINPSYKIQSHLPIPLHYHHRHRQRHRPLLPPLQQPQNNMYPADATYPSHQNLYAVHPSPLPPP
ncbi:hypothetical protein Scep_007615 [Stephania cephalantha]|uniref:Uncharacterized protein n=1 Tax=Stephania cephalantha TaxID=152367 RepID=A0AAP0KA67_9MAGN